ncbi:MAG: aldehyde ferredoxin oxidoreductase N-terminal domain-containing protein [Syntrophaceae bacterium]
MSLYRPFYNGKYGVVDLTSLSAYTVDLPWEACQDHIGGAAMNAWLLSQYESDSLILGTGPLTGSFAPASALLVGTFRSPRYDHLCHVPFMLRSGPELKFSGLDALVIRGAAKEPCALSVGRGQVRALAVPELPGKTVPELLQLLRQSAPGFRASIISGPAADNDSPFASASIGGHGSFDKVGLAARMAAKNLKAVLFNGIEGLPFREDHPALSKATQKMLRDSGALAAEGFAPVLKKLADGSEAAGALRGKLGRNRACYHCPSPCMTYAAPGKPGPGKEGVLLLDHAGWAALSRKSEDALPLLKRCLELGLDPCAVGNALREDRPLREAMNAVEALARAGASIDEEEYPSAPGIDSRTYRLFGGGITPIASGSAWPDRVAAAMLLGICPVFMQIAGRLDRSDLLRFLSSDAEEIKALTVRLDGQIEKVLEGKIPESGIGDRV